MAIESTIPDSYIDGVQQYSTQDPTGGNTPGVVVPPAVLQMLMKTSAALSPKPSATPPHPQVTAALTAIPLGYQFAFNQLTSPTPYGNTISAYRIYRNKTSNAFSGSQLIRTITHDPTHQGAVTVQDSTGGNVNYFYFVTAVDSTGQESSTPGAFQASAVTSGAANPNVANAVGTTNSPTTTSATYVVVPEMTVTVTTKGNKVLLTFTGTFQYTSTTTQASVAFFRDGVQISKDIVWVPFGTTGLVIAVTYIDAPSAGSHTFDLRWHGDGSSTLTASGTLRQMQVVELG